MIRHVDDQHAAEYLVGELLLVDRIGRAGATPGCERSRAADHA